MGRTVAELMRTISSEELTQWMAFNIINPIGDQRGDLQAGLVAASIFNSKRTKPSDRVFTPSDFRLFAEQSDKKRETSKQIRRNFERLKKA